MQTAIQQMIDFINDINDNDSSEFNYYYGSIITKLNELLEVEKQQISAAPELRYKDGTPIRKYNSSKLQAIENEISDDLLTEEEIAEFKRELKEVMKKPKTEISDEEIDKIAKEYVLYNESKRNWVVEGMKLYREQLKKK